MSESMLLVQLQTIDLKLLKAASTLAAMPQHKRLETIELAKKKLSSEYNKIVGLRKDAELEVKDLESQHETYQKKEQETQERAAAETDYRAIQDYDQQLSTLAKALEKTSFKLIEAQKVLQKLKHTEAGAETMFTKLNAELETTHKALVVDTASLQSRVLKLKDEREHVVSQLSEDTLTTYENARKRFKGLAVEYLDGNTPSICRVTLQPSSFHDLAHGPNVTECPYCHRILVTDYTLEKVSEKEKSRS